MLIGLLAAYCTDTEQATLVTPEAPVLAHTTEPQSNGEQSNVQVAAIDPKDFDPADFFGRR